MTVFLYFIRVMNHYKSLPKLLFGFDMIRICNNTVGDRANFLAGWLVVMPDTFRAEYGVDHIDIVAHRNCIIRAFGQTHIAVGTFVGNQ